MALNLFLSTILTNELDFCLLTLVYFVIGCCCGFIIHFYFRFQCGKTEDYLQNALDQCKRKTYSNQKQPQSIPKTINTVNVGLIFNPPRTGT
jgi:hypothetical protein